MMNLFLDQELTFEEVISIKKQYSKFRDEVESIIKNSNLFEEPLNYLSKRKFQYFENGMNWEKSFLEIHLKGVGYTKEKDIEEAEKKGDIEMMSVYSSLDKTGGWNGFYFTLWEFVIEKQKTGFLFKTEKDVITEKEEHEFYPTLITNDFVEYHKSIILGVRYKEIWNLPLDYFDFKKMLKEKKLNITSEELNFLNKIFKCLSKYIKIVKKENISNTNKLLKKQILLISELDKDGDGKVDFIDSESYDKLLSKNQKDIIEIDKNYIQKFVKISIYLKTKKNNTQKIFESINSTNDDKELTELVNLLKNQIHTYDLLVFHSISMMISLLKEDLISFNEIYICFDQLGVFNSNWENEVSDKLTDIGNGINELMYSINKMENKIVSSIDNLTYVTKDSFRELSDSVEKQLTNIDSTIKFNNFLNVIQTYQMYKINKNTKRLS